MPISYVMHSPNSGNHMCLSLKWKHKNYFGKMPLLMTRITHIYRSLPLNLLTGWMPFLSHKQQLQSTKYKAVQYQLLTSCWQKELRCTPELHRRGGGWVGSSRLIILAQLHIMRRHSLRRHSSHAAQRISHCASNHGLPTQHTHSPLDQPEDYTHYSSVVTIIGFQHALPACTSTFRVDMHPSTPTCCISKHVNYATQLRSLLTQPKCTFNKHYTMRYTYTPNTAAVHSQLSSID